MIHKRIRPFNTKETYPEQKLNNDLSQGVVARGTMVFLRGQVAQDLDTRESVAIGDPGAQAEKVMDNIELLLGVGVGGVERAHAHVPAGGDPVAHRGAPVAAGRSRPALI